MIFINFIVKRIICYPTFPKVTEELVFVLQERIGLFFLGGLDCKGVFRKSFHGVFVVEVIDAPDKYGDPNSSANCNEPKLPCERLPEGPETAGLLGVFDDNCQAVSVCCMKVGRVGVGVSNVNDRCSGEREREKKKNRGRRKTEQRTDR